MSENPKEIFLQIFDETNSSFLDMHLVQKNVERILSSLLPESLHSVDLDLLFVDDQAMKQINSERRSLEKTTDVLSFPLYQADLNIPHQHLGEVVISVDTLSRQAEEIGHSKIEELYRLLVHGILHLLGYEHETNEADAQRMRAKEDECLAMIFNS
ncbi:endoribonuclease YbeY [Leptospira ryugenii]|uniref:Endoribonuclease YbeY n=1 Tax=Leptospira ryugenii TaxID=1917863 RepID=A0A2P2DVT0_9LEPT|nr:rRNA maturation RNase YbeY [Leptospira ryugenii]GBF48742.1 endoribonuclease YbeY [Leptospira ryugenii]